MNDVMQFFKCNTCGRLVVCRNKDCYKMQGRYVCDTCYDRFFDEITFSKIVKEIENV